MHFDPYNCFHLFGLACVFFLSHWALGCKARDAWSSDLWKIPYAIIHVVYLIVTGLFIGALFCSIVGGRERD